MDETGDELGAPVDEFSEEMTRVAEEDSDRPRGTVGVGPDADDHEGDDQIEESLFDVDRHRGTSGDYEDFKAGPRDILLKLPTGHKGGGQGLFFGPISPGRCRARPGARAGTRRRSWAPPGSPGVGRNARTSPRRRRPRRPLRQ